MKHRRGLVLWALAVVLIGVPLSVDRWLAARDARRAALAKSAECYPFPCLADFNRNGTLDRLEVDRAGPLGRFDRWLTVFDGERELFRCPYYYLDNTSRMHAAVYQPGPAEAPRLLIFSGRRGWRVSAVFAWDGQEMRQAAATSLDREILSAMAARDGAGGAHDRALRRRAPGILLPIYCLAVGVALSLLNFFWLRRGRSSLP